MSDKNADAKRTAFRFNRHFFQGLVVGVLAAVIIGLGITAIVNPDVFRGNDAAETEALPGGVQGQTAQVVTPQDFEAAVLRSDRPELVLVVDAAGQSTSLDSLVEWLDLVWEGNGVKYYYATDAASRDYITKLSVHTGEEQPSLAIFHQGRLVAQQSLLMDADSAALWVTRNNPAKPAPTSTSTTVAPPEPQPANGPAIFRAFSRPMHDWLRYDPASSYYLGEVVLTAVTYEIEGFVKADRAITEPITWNTALFSLVGNAFGGDATHFVLPDLSGQLPLVGLTYQIRTDGVFPGRDAEEQVRSYTVGDIKYLEIPVATPQDLNAEIHWGDIVLARNAEDVPGFVSKRLVLCDGRELQVDQYPVLANLLGSRFGGDGTTSFNVPDLTGTTPIEGAQYYIVVDGLYPPSK